MGSQQLLLIALGIILVGIAVWVGMNMFFSYAQQNNRDQVRSTLVALSNMAQEYYKKPAEIGGGGGSYVGWVRPKSFKKTDFGSFSSRANKNRAKLVGNGTEIGLDGKKKIKIIAFVRKTGLTWRVRN